jgi:hypothetical protein
MVSPGNQDENSIDYPDAVSLQKFRRGTGMAYEFLYHQSEPATDSAQKRHQTKTIGMAATIIPRSKLY